MVIILNSQLLNTNSTNETVARFCNLCDCVFSLVLSSSFIALSYVLNSYLLTLLIQACRKAHTKLSKTILYLRNTYARVIRKSNK